MNDLNWCEIGPTQTHRYKTLSDFLNSQGIPNQFTFIKSEISNLKEKIKEAQDLKLAIRFHPQFIDQITTNIANSRRDLDAVKTIDSLMYDSKRGYWPEILLREAIFEYLTLKIKNLDISQKVFIVGAGGLARSAISAMIKLGFSRINLTGEEDEGSQKLINDFKEIYFNVQFEYTKRKDVTILPGTHGIVVNTVSILESNNFPTEIYYFNFLKKGGLVFDLIDVPPETPFTKIAKDIGAQVVHGYEIFGYYDLSWVEHLAGRKLDLTEYLKLLKTNLEQVSYDKNKIQKILAEFQI